jgi:hypothetical protein
LGRIAVIASGTLRLAIVTIESLNSRALNPLPP